MKKEKSCGVVCFRKKKGRLEFLLIRHRYGGHWSFPKGHVEKGETEEQTALRELYEETGATVKLIPGFKQVTAYSPAKGVLKDVVFFLGELETAKLICQPQEVSAIELLPLAKALERLSYQSDKDILQNAVDFLNQY